MKYDSLNQFVETGYRYAMEPFERQIPLPSTSVKIPYKEKDLRIMKVNNEKRQIEQLRNQIQRKCQIEELRYQNTLRQMKKQNEINRLVLEKKIKNSQRNVFDLPQITQISTERRRMSKYDKMRDSLDQLSINEREGRPFQHRKIPVDIERRSFSERQSVHSVNSNRSVKENSHKDRLSARTHRSYQQIQENEDEERQKKTQRLKMLDYVYKKNPPPKKSSNFILEPNKKELEKLDDDKDNYLWVKKVRDERRRLGLDEIQEKSSDSSPSSDESRSND